jgi:hypothetical protein
MIINYLGVTFSFLGEKVLIKSKQRGFVFLQLKKGVKTGNVVGRPLKCDTNFNRVFMSFSKNGF